MSWTHVATITKLVGDTDGFSMDSALNVAAGDLVLAVVCWDPSGTAPTISVAATSGEANTLTMSTYVQDAGGSAGSVLAYKINAAANTTSTFAVSLSSTRSRVVAIVSQWSPSAGSVALVAGPSTGSSNSGTNPTSGTISPSGTDLLVIGGGGSYYGAASDGLIGSAEPVAETYTTKTSGRETAAIIAKTYTENQTDIDCEWTLDESRNWTANILAFENTAAAGGGSPLLLMDHFNGGVAL